jgi:ribonuclease R
VAGALRFELLSEGRAMPRGGKRPGARDAAMARGKSHPGRSPRKQDREPGKARSGKTGSGKSKKGKS